jgi:hypothetical protein
MSKLITTIVALATVVVAGLAIAQQPAATATTPPMAPIKRTILQKADVPEKPVKINVIYVVEKGKPLASPAP